MWKVQECGGRLSAPSCMVSAAHSGGPRATVAMGCEEVSGEKPSGWGLVKFQGSGWLKARWL